MPPKHLLFFWGENVFSLEAFVKTKGKSANKKDITPQKFKEGNVVRRIDYKHAEKTYLVLTVYWLGNGWFYDVHPIVGSFIGSDGKRCPIVLPNAMLINGEFLVKA